MGNRKRASIKNFIVGAGDMSQMTLITIQRKIQERKKTNSNWFIYIQIYTFS